jgi:hypothetical protein
MWHYSAMAFPPLMPVPERTSVLEFAAPSPKRGVAGPQWAGTLDQPRTGAGAGG